MREIKIYLAYAPEDKPYDREELGNFIRQQNDIARKRRDPVFLRLVECEDQAQIPEDTMLVLSLSVARGGGTQLLEQLWEEENSPAIMTYFRMPDKDQPVQESYLQLKKWLEEKGHYWNEYPDVAVVMFKLLVYFQQKKIDGFFYTKDDDEIRLDGLPLLKSRDFCALRDHPDLKQLDAQIAQLDTQLRCERTDLAEYRDRFVKRNMLRKQKMSIIRTYYEQLEDTEDAVSDRIRRARSAIARGDFPQAEQLLDPEQIRREVDENIHNRAFAVMQAQAQGRRELKMRLQEYLECARVLQLKLQDAQQILRVRKVLLEASELERQEELGYSARMAQAAYLLQWAPAEEAMLCARELVNSFADTQISPEHARACHLLARACYLAEVDGETVDAEYEKAIRIWQAMYAQDPEKWLSEWGECCLDRILIADAYSKEAIAKAEALVETVWIELEKRFHLREERVWLLAARLHVALGEMSLAAGDHDMADYYFAGALNYIPETEDPSHLQRICGTEIQLCQGKTLLQRGKIREAKDMLQQALEQFQKLPPEVAERNQRLHFLCVMHLGHAWMYQSDEEAECCFQLALQILNERIGHNKEDQAEIASLYASLGTLYAKQKQLQLARSYWDKADAICDMLAQTRSSRTLLTLIRCYRYIGDGYLYAGRGSDDQDYSQCSRDYFSKAVKLHERLETPDFQAGLETWTLFTKYLGRFDFSDRKICKNLYKRLSRFEKYSDQQEGMQRAIFYANYAMLCHGAGVSREAETAYRTALDAYWPYVRTLPQMRVERYGNYAILYARILLKNSTGKRRAVDALLKVKEQIKQLPESHAQLTALCTVCRELVRLYKIPPEEKAWKAVAAEHDNAQRLLQKKTIR